MADTEPEQKPLPVKLIAGILIILCVAAAAAGIILLNAGSAQENERHAAAPASQSSSSSGSTGTTGTAPSGQTSVDPVIGTWTGTKTISLILVSYNGEGTVTFNSDHSAHAEGYFRGPGLDKTFSVDFTWENLGGNTYRGVSASKSLDFSLSGDTLTMTVNPKKFGVIDLLDMDIDIDMKRV